MKNNFNFKKFLGFTLVELMISLIAISVITAVFVPIVSRKVEKDKILSEDDKEVFTGDDCNIKPNDNTYKNYCRMCYKTNGIECIHCLLTCKIGEYKDIKNCKCEICPIARDNSVCIKCNTSIINNAAECNVSVNTLMNNLGVEQEGYSMKSIGNDEYEILEEGVVKRIYNAKNKTFTDLNTTDPSVQARQSQTQSSSQPSYIPSAPGS